LIVQDLTQNQQEQNLLGFNFGAEPEAADRGEREPLELYGAAGVVEGLGLTTKPFLMHQF
jgi:hypothetical protein